MGKLFQCSPKVVLIEQPLLSGLIRGPGKFLALKINLAEKFRCLREVCDMLAALSAVSKALSKPGYLRSQNGFLYIDYLPFVFEFQL